MADAARAALEGRSARASQVMSSSKKSSCAARCAAIVLAVCLSGCSQSEGLGFERKLGAPVRIDSKGAQPRLFASSAERFGTFMSGAASAAEFAYVAPSGWSERPPTDLRVINFQIGEQAGTECYVTVLGGDAGGALANINRWCGQLKIPAWTQKDLDAAPRIVMFGADTVLVTLDDTSTDRMMLGVQARLDARSVFVKLTGSRAAVSAQREAFVAFCSSLKKKG